LSDQRRLSGALRAHVFEINGNAAKRRTNLTLKRASRAKWSHREAMAGTDANNALHIVARLRTDESRPGGLEASHVVVVFACVVIQEKCRAPPRSNKRPRA
jgi:hypothetical protein